MILIEASFDKLVSFIKRSATARFIFRVLEKQDSTTRDSIFALVQRIDFSSYPLGSFRVRAYKFYNPVTDWNRHSLEVECGAHIFQGGFVVDLVNFDWEFSIIAWDAGTIVGIKYAELKKGAIEWKSPKLLPYSRGGAMKQILVRLLVNLSGVDSSHYALDPFCGHGGFLYEMIEVGYNVLGLELDLIIIRQALGNSKATGFDDLFVIIAGSALLPPFRPYSIYKYITDPPYSFQTKTFGAQVGTLLFEWLESLQIGSVVCFSTPNNVLPQLPSDWKQLLSGVNRVHKRLTRNIRVIYNG